MLNIKYQPNFSTCNITATQEFKLRYIHTRNKFEKQIISEQDISGHLTPMYPPSLACTRRRERHDTVCLQGPWVRLLTENRTEQTLTEKTKCEKT